MNSSADWLWWLLPGYCTLIHCMILFRRSAAGAVTRPEPASLTANARR